VDVGNDVSAGAPATYHAAGATSNGTREMARDDGIAYDVAREAGAGGGGGGAAYLVQHKQQCQRLGADGRIVAGI